MISIKKDEKASLSMLKIIGICLILILCSGVAVMATSSKVRNVKIILSDNYEKDVFTSKTKVSEILEENHIVVLPDEKVIPGEDADITDSNTIKISKASEAEIQVAEVTEENTNTTIDKILENYAPIIEKIEVIQEEIPFETITKDVSNDAKATTNQVIKNGKNGIKEVTYKVKYQNYIEIERTEISSEVIKKPVDKVVQIKQKVTSRSGIRTASSDPAASSSSTLAKRAEGRTPTVRTMNASAYCSCAKCCGKTNGKTASGATATPWYTIAAGKGLPIGTIVYIPALSNKPNGGWFIVQDRGGAISNNRIDIFTGSHSEALGFGRRNLECYVYM